MMQFSYRAVDQNGKNSIGEMSASNVDMVADRLKKQGLIALDISAARTGLIAVLNKPLFDGNAISSKILLGITRELATLVGAGLTLVKSLSVLCALSNDKKTKKLLARLLQDIREGESLQSALSVEKGQFPKYYISMIGAGEASGKLGNVLDKLSDYLQRSVDVREKTTSALVYPAILMVMVVVAMALIITVVLPQFEPIFAQSEGKLPLITEIVMGISRVVNQHSGLILIVIAITSLGGVAILRTERFRRKIDRKILSLFLIGEMIKKHEFGRFHRMLGTLLENGLPLVTAMTIAMDGISNHHITAGLRGIFTRLKEGASLSHEYHKVDFVPLLAVELTRVGEDTGRLSGMLIRTADIMDQEVQSLIDKFMALLVPVMTILMGFIIAGMIASVLLGIMSINEVAF